MLRAPIPGTEQLVESKSLTILPPSPHRGPPPIYHHPSLQALHPCPEAFDDVTYVAHFVKLGLEIINLAQNVSKAGNFSVGGGNGGLSARGLVESGALGLRGEMIDPALDRSHQPLEVTAQYRQTSGIQQQPSASGPLP